MDEIPFGSHPPSRIELKPVNSQKKFMFIEFSEKCCSALLTFCLGVVLVWGDYIIATKRAMRITENYQIIAF